LRVFVKIFPVFFQDKQTIDLGYRQSGCFIPASFEFQSAASMVTAFGEGYDSRRSDNDNSRQGIDFIPSDSWGGIGRLLTFPFSLPLSSLSRSPFVNFIYAHHYVAFSLVFCYAGGMVLVFRLCLSGIFSFCVCRG
jgi:hypothetical protein